MPGIGESLREARVAAGIELDDAERTIRIRVRYLDALENEEWDVLPGPTYVRGFLRTYATYLGLDADALVDEYRRTIEHSPATEQPYLFSEPLLERRRRPLQPQRRSWGQILAVLGVLLLAVGAVYAVVRVDPLNWFSDSGADAKHHKARHHQGHGSHGSKRSHGKGNASSGKPVTLALVTHDEMVICLLPGHGRPLIDSQTLVAGSKQGPFQPPADNYRLDLISGGSVTVVLGGKPERVQSKRPASYAIDSGGISSIPYKGKECP